TPHLGGLFPQNATAALVTAIAVAFTIAPTAPAIAGAPGAAATPAATSVSQTVVDRSAAARHRDPAVTAHPAAVDAAGEAELGDYTVVRGDTLWEIADEQLDDPTRYPEIVEASEGITQPDGRQLTDPDLILPGWTLNVPDQATEQAQGAAPADEPVAEAGPAEVPAPTASAEDSPTPGAPVVPPTTPLSAAAAPPSTPAGGGPALSAARDAPLAAPAVPGTPMSATGEQPVDPPVVAAAREAVYDDEGRFAPSHGVLGLPEWITYPLIPTRPEDAPELMAEVEAILARHAAKVAAARAAGDLPATNQGKAT
ncbi:MAG: LysM peptidoglycan-binding domain-containing protein, partial [Candidatus Nanopelagicales bacterium]